MNQGFWSRLHVIECYRLKIQNPNSEGFFCKCHAHPKKTSRSIKIHQPSRFHLRTMAKTQQTSIVEETLAKWFPVDGMRSAIRP
jgi:hypothetical protein